MWNSQSVCSIYEAFSRDPKENNPMKWMTREHVKVDRVACPWLIKKFVDQDAEFLFVPSDQVREVAEREGATPYDVKNVELGHHGKECSFEAILKKYNLTNDPALVLLGKIVNGADTDNTIWNQPEGSGLEPLPRVSAILVSRTTTSRTPPNGLSMTHSTPIVRKWCARASPMATLSREARFTW